MPIPEAELTIDFGPIAPDAPEDAPASFGVRNERTGESWSGGKFRSPLDEQARNDIRWYLEEYYQWPFGPFRDRAHGIEARLEAHGRALFDALFDARKPARIYEHFLNTRADVRTLTILSDAPRVMGLPWELLAESTGPLFTKRPPISIRRRVRLEHAPDVRHFELPLRVLFVNARPEGAGFVNPRSVARGLLDALERLGGAVAVEFLRPPTLAALDAALRRADEDEGRPYHIVHFDGHGVYHGRTGLGQLAFEHDDCSVDHVDANRLGALLNECGVPLVILNACQSAQGDQSNPFSSIATRLLEAGVGGVLSMSHSVLVVTAARFVAAFYDALVRGKPVGRATDEARRVLVQDTRRHAIAPRPDAPEEVIELHDWFLPVLYQQRADVAPFADVDTRLAAPAAAPVLQALTDPRAPGGLPPHPLHGFHGRERELLRLERLFRDHPVVVVHGYGGQGKTALAAEAARWLYRTGRFPAGAAFISFEQGVGDELALSWTRQALLGDDFATAEQVADALRERPGLVIFDNFETVLERGDLPLTTADLQDLLDLAWQWVGGDTVAAAPGGRLNPDGPRLLITTRDIDFNDSRYAPSRRCAHVELGGLADHEALELAKAVLTDRGIDHAAVPREPLRRLMDFLGGHPLSLYLVLPHLSRRTPDELIAEFDQLLPGFTTGAAKERNESLTVSLDFSLRRLSPEAVQVLPNLAVFQMGACEAPLVQVTGFTFQVWDAIRSELVQAGLASLDDTGASLGTKDASDEQRHSSFYVKFHPTLLPYLETLLPPERRAELETRYRQAYHALARYLHHEDDKNPHAARALASRDLPNLRRALDLVLARAAALPPDPSTGHRGEPVEPSGQAYEALEAAADFADSVIYFLDKFGRWRERDALLRQVEAISSDTLGLEMMRTRVESLRKQGQLAEAIRLLIKMVDASDGLERAYLLTDLGRCLDDAGNSERAVSVYREAIQLYDTSSKKDSRMHGVCYAELAGVLVSIGKYQGALVQYERAQSIFEEIGHREGLAGVYGNLGVLAYRQGNLAEAMKRHQQSREIYHELGMPREEAVDLLQLGNILANLHRWDESEKYYRECLKILEQMQDYFRITHVYNNLGNLAARASRLTEAESWYRRALAIGEQLGSQKEIAQCANNLAGLLLDVEALPPTARPAPFLSASLKAGADRDLLAEAEAYARRAQEIREALNDPSSEVWNTYGLLAQIAERKGLPEEARRWRRREQESFAAFAGAGAHIQQFEPLIAQVVAACQGSEEARKWVEGEFPKMAAGGEEWAQNAAIIRRILDGERNAENLMEGLGHTSALIVRRILGALAGEAQPSPRPAATPPPQAGEGPEEGGITLEQVFGLVEAGCRGDTQAGQLAYGLVTQVLQASEAPPELRTLGKTLQRILEGLRGEEALAGLPAELRPPVEELLRRLE